MYDPKRSDVVGYVARMRHDRSVRALGLLIERHRVNAILANTTWDIKVRNEIVRRNVRPVQAVRLDVASLRQQARDNWEFATNRSGYGARDTEYYSACGYDDYIGEQKDYSRSLALEIWRTVGRFD